MYDIVPAATPTTPTTPTADGLVVQVIADPYIWLAEVFPS